LARGKENHLADLAKAAPLPAPRKGDGIGVLSVRAGEGSDGWKEGGVAVRAQVYRQTIKGQFSSHLLYETEGRYEG